MFGDFQIDAGASIGDVCEFYELPVPQQPEQAVGDWLRAHLGRPPVVSDEVRHGHAVFVVRALHDGVIVGVGLGLGAGMNDADKAPSVGKLVDRH